MNEPFPLLDGNTLSVSDRLDLIAMIVDDASRDIIIKVGELYLSHYYSGVSSKPSGDPGVDYIVTLREALRGAIRPMYHSDPLAYPPLEAAHVSGRSHTRIKKAIREGELTARKDGKATLIEHAELKRWIESFPTIGRVPHTEEDHVHV